MSVSSSLYAACSFVVVNFTVIYFGHIRRARYKHEADITDYHSLLSTELTLLRNEIEQLKASLEIEKAHRQSERSSRIALQQRTREEKIERNITAGFTFMPIGVVKSPFKDRRGTPRQPVLVPAARGRICFDRKIVQTAHFKEIDQFSHIWVNQYITDKCF